MKIIVSYLAPRQTDLDDKIRDALKTVGIHWYAQGTNHIAGMRDIAFEYRDEDDDVRG